MKGLSDSKIISVRNDFPILSKTIYGKPLVYFDNAATTQKPIQVIDAISNYYRNDNANVHRGVHYLSQYATETYEVVRKKVAGFLNAEFAHEIIFFEGSHRSNKSHCLVFFGNILARRRRNTYFSP